MSKDDDWKKKYDTCRVCGKEIPELLKSFAYRKLEQQTCSTECTRKEIIQRFACCDKAEFLTCVCMYSFRCSVHGDRHIGTHD